MTRPRRTPRTRAGFWGNPSGRRSRTVGSAAAGLKVGLAVMGRGRTRCLRPCAVASRSLSGAAVGHQNWAPLWSATCRRAGPANPGTAGPSACSPPSIGSGPGSALRRCAIGCALKGCCRRLPKHRRGSAHDGPHRERGRRPRGGVVQVLRPCVVGHVSRRRMRRMRSHSGTATYVGGTWLAAPGAD